MCYRCVVDVYLVVDESKMQTVDSVAIFKFRSVFA